MLNRRQFFQSLASAGAVMGLPRLAFAASPQGRKFLFIVTEGGWDPLCVFAPMFDSSVIEMETGTQAMSIGDFRLVDHAERPSVRRFFEDWGSSTVVIDGMSTRSISHEVCAMIALTGDSSGSSSDWPTLIALSEQDQYPMPSLVFSGFDRAFAATYPGDHEALVARTGQNGQLEAMLQGYYIEDAQRSVVPLPTHARDILDRFVRQKSQTLEKQFARRHGDKLLRDFNQSLHQVEQLRAVGGEISFSSEEGASSIDSAIAALSMGLCRCVTLADGRDWDTHVDNTTQNPQFEDLFNELHFMLDKMAVTPGTQGGSLLDETVVVVMSEMGRTPLFNSTGGRDHWPYTTAMVIGSDLAGGRSLGAYNDSFAGLGFDPTTGALRRDAPSISAADFGATLLSLAGIDPVAALPGAQSFHRALL